ncbi:MAG: 2-amino-4-hydroxy-6-hydroxymethyldihydropteridine diphosphokinase [bacterium]
MAQNNKIILCLGSNLEDRHKNIKTSIALLKRHKIKITGYSSLYETDPVGFENQPKFYNMAVTVSTDLSPEQLLSAVKRIESLMGRREAKRFHPRLIDIDILIYNDIIVEVENLSIPHKRLLERHFALKLLMDIDENMPIPGSGMTVKEAYEKVGKEHAAVKLSDKELKGVL